MRLRTLGLSLCLLVTVVWYAHDLQAALWVNRLGVALAEEAASSGANDRLLYAPGHTLDCQSTSLTAQDNIVSAWQKIVPSNRSRKMLESYLILCGYPMLALEFLEPNMGRCIDSFDAYWVGRIYADLDDTERAMACWQVGRDVDIGFANFGALSQNLGDDDDALYYFDLAERINPREDPRKEIMYRDLCVILLRRGAFSEALINCERLVRLDPGWPPGHALLASALRSLGQMYEAEMEYLKAIDVDTSYPWAYLNLGDLYLEQGRTAQAVEMYEKVVSLNVLYASAAGQGKLMQIRDLEP